MADEKTVDLRIDASQGAQALNEVEKAAEGAADAMGDLSGAIQKTEENVKRVVSASRDYNAAARSVGDSVQNITRFEASYKASLNDTANSAQVRAQILAASFARTIGGAADEARAAALLAAGHKEAAAAVRFMLDNHAKLPGDIDKATGSTRNFGAVAQQAGYQIADMANQIGNGTSVFVAAGQQMGQLLGVFGAAGAVVGAVVAVLGPLAANMLDASRATKEAEAAQKDYNAALREGEELLLSEAALEDAKARRMQESAIQARTDQYAKLQEEVRALELKRRENTAVTPTETGEGDATILSAKEEKRLSELISIKQAQLGELQGQITALTTQNPRANTIAKGVLTTSETREDLEGKRASLQAGIDDAAANGDTAALTRLTEAYGAVNRAIATYVTDGERAVLVAEAQAKASTMGAVEGQRYLAQRQAEIGLMGKVIEQGEAEKTIAAARIEANSAAAKSYRDMAKAMSAGEIDTHAKVALAGLEKEREALAQRRQMSEITVSEELALAIDIGDRQRRVEEGQAQAKLALLRRTAGVERAEIDAAERAITELRAKHVLDRQKQVDEEAAHRKAVAKQLAEIEADAVAAKGNAGISAKTEDVGFRKSMGQINGSEEIAALRQIADEKYQIELDLLQKKLQLAGVEEAERARINAQIVALDEKRAAEMTRLDHQASLNRLQEIRSVTAPFTQATTMMTQGFIQGTLTRQQLAARAAQSIAVSYANMGVRVATDWFHTNVLMAAWDKMFGQQKVATAAATEAGKTAATRAGVASRTAAGATEDASFFARAARQVSEWMGFETAKTGGTVVGEATRTGVTAVGAATREAVETTETATSVGKSAARGAAGTYADACENIPYGWLIGAGLAAASFAAIMAFSSYGGEAEVPYDGALYQLHAKETVLPAKYAEPLRNLLSGGGFPGMPAYAPPQLTAAMPRFGLPSFLGRPIGGEIQAPSNSINNTKGDTIVNLGGITVNGKLRADDIDNFEAAATRAVAKGIRNGNPDALSITRKK